MNKNFDELLYGEYHAKKLSKFNEALSAIEEKHIDYFRKREPKFPRQKHDRLSNHYMIIQDKYKIQFGFENNTDLRQDIINECLRIFNECFRETKE